MSIRPTEGTHGAGVDALEEAVALLDEAIQLEADQADQNVMRQCSAKLQGVLAKNQREADQSLRGKATARSIRRMASRIMGG